MPAIHLIPGLPAILIIVRRHRTGEVLILANADEPWREIFNVARGLLWRHERRELLRRLVA